MNSKYLKRSKEGTIVKSWVLVALASSYKLSLTQNKLIDLYVSKIDADNPETKTVTFTTQELAKILDINRPRTERVLKDLEVLKSPITFNYKGVPLTIKLFKEAQFEAPGGRKSGIFTLECSDEAIKYFFKLDTYLKYQADNINGIHSLKAYNVFLFCTFIESTGRSVFNLPLWKLATLIGYAPDTNVETVREICRLVEKYLKSNGFKFICKVQKDKVTLSKLYRVDAKQDKKNKKDKNEKQPRIIKINSGNITNGDACIVINSQGKVIKLSPEQNRIIEQVINGEVAETTPPSPPSNPSSNEALSDEMMDKMMDKMTKRLDEFCSELSYKITQKFDYEVKIIKTYFETRLITLDAQIRKFCSQFTIFKTALDEIISTNKGTKNFETLDKVENKETQKNEKHFARKKRLGAFEYKKWNLDEVKRIINKTSDEGKNSKDEKWDQRYAQYYEKLNKQTRPQTNDTDASNLTSMFSNLF